MEFPDTESLGAADATRHAPHTIAPAVINAKNLFMAELVGCNTSHISNIENNYTKVSLNVLLAIANALDTSIDYLLFGQYENAAFALDNEILRALADCDNQKKEKILKIIEII